MSKPATFRKQLTVLDLFAGIGGFSLGLERAGMRTIAFCEIDPFCRQVLKKHWPDVPCHHDIAKLRGEDVGQVDVVCGGPPCQQTSVAAAPHGCRTGGTLWPWMHSMARQLRPSWIIVEQPPGNQEWENQVSMDLEGLGYSVSKFIPSAVACGAPHIRRRSVFLANRNGARLQIARLAAERALSAFKGTPASGGDWSPDYARTVRVDDGVPGGLDRRQRIAALGNAFIPQIPELIGRAIMDVERGG